MFFDHVFFRHIRARPARPKTQLTILPDDPGLWRHNRPIHACETIYKKLRGALFDAMGGFEPSRENLARTPLPQFSKAHEGMHLVKIAADLLVDFLQPSHLVIDIIGQKIGVRL